MKGSKIKKFFLNPWTVGIGVAIFGFFLTIVGDVVTGEKIFSTFVTGALWMWNAIISFLAFNLKVWWVLVCLGIVALSLLIYSKVAIKKTQKDSFLSYTEDDILGYCFRWEWRIDCYGGKYVPRNINPICSNCGTPLVNDYVGENKFKCLRCDKRYKKQLPDRTCVEMMIFDNVRLKFHSNKEEN